MRETFELQAKDCVIAIGGFAAASSLQSFQWDPQFNEQQHSQLGDETYTGISHTIEISGSMESEATGSTVALLKRMILVKDADGSIIDYMAGIPGGPDDSNAGTIRTRDFERAHFDLAFLKAPDSLFDQAELLPSVYLTQISFSADVNGTARETYSFAGDDGLAFPAPFHDVRGLLVTRVDDTTLANTSGVLLDTEGTPDTDATHRIAFLQLGTDQIPASELTVDDVSQEITLLGGKTVKAGVRAAVIVYKKVPGAMPEITNATTARWVKANHIDIFLVKKSVVDVAAMADGELNAFDFSDGDRFLRAQSFSLSIDLRREPQREIRKRKNTPVYHRSVTYPLAITASVNVNEQGLSTWAKLQGKGESDILNLSDFEAYDCQIVVRYYKDNGVLQTMALCDARVNGKGAQVSVGGRAEVAWSFAGSDIVIEGSNA
jgi:hypothetical protein